MTIHDIRVISNTRDCRIELIHRNSEPHVWNVKRWRKFLWFKKKISSNLFDDEHQAIAFACDMKLRYVGEPVNYFYNRKVRSRHETN